MAHYVLDNTQLATQWPNQRETAEMLGISESTLSRRTDLDFETAGHARHYRPTTILQAGAIYKRRSLNELAAELIAFAQKNGGEEYAEQVRAEVDEFFANRPGVPVDRERFLKEAQRALPRRLFREVQRAFDQGVTEEPELHGAEANMPLPLS